MTGLTRYYYEKFLLSYAQYMLAQKEWEQVKWDFYKDHWYKAGRLLLDSYCELEHWFLEFKKALK